MTCASVAVPAILNEAVPATTQNVDAVLQHNMKMAYKYTGEHALYPALYITSKEPVGSTTG